MGDLRFRPRVVGVVETWKHILSGDETLSFPGLAGPRRWPKGNIFPRARSMRQKPTSGVGASRTCGEVSTREISIVTLGLLES